jgi:hypothetical protein
MTAALIRRGGLIWDLTGEKPMLEPLVLHVWAADLADHVIWENFQAGDDEDYWNVTDILADLEYIDSDGTSSDEELVARWVAHAPPEQRFSFLARMLHGWLLTLSEDSSFRRWLPVTPHTHLLSLSEDSAEEAAITGLLNLGTPAALRLGIAPAPQVSPTLHEAMAEIAAGKPCDPETALAICRVLDPWIQEPTDTNS